VKKKLPKILIVDDDQKSIELMKRMLSEDEYRFFSCTDGIDAEEKATTILPDLILLNVEMPGMSGFEVSKMLRKKISLTNIPIIMVTSHTDDIYKDIGYASGIDDYITKPIVNPNEVRRRVKYYVERTKYCIQASPLTGLPGNIAVEYELRDRIDKQLTFGVAYIDIDQFKSYNDTYSWHKGDNVIRDTAKIITQAIEIYDGDDIFLGHLGGDDFIAIMPLDNIKVFAEKIIQDFDRMILGAYEQAERNRGYVIHRDRQGNMYCFPLLSISVAICTNENMTFVHSGQVSQIGLEIKEYLKTLLGSNYLIDRRSNQGDSVLME